MTANLKAHELADALETPSLGTRQTLDNAAAELRRLHAANVDCLEHFNALKAERDALLAVTKELQESAAYWSEYDVPLGIVDRLNAAIAKAEA